MHLVDGVLILKHISFSKVKIYPVFILFYLRSFFIKSLAITWINITLLATQMYNLSAGGNLYNGKHFPSHLSHLLLQTTL